MCIRDRDTLRRSLGQELGAFLLVVTVIGMFGWMPTSRIVRGSVLSIKRKEYVEAAVNVGARDNSIMMRHIPVSYTHLDVYKRQGAWRPFG